MRGNRPVDALRRGFLDCVYDRWSCLCGRERGKGEQDGHGEHRHAWASELFNIPCAPMKTASEPLRTGPDAETSHSDPVRFGCPDSDLRVHGPDCVGPGLTHDGVHILRLVLFAPGDARRTDARHSGAGGASGARDDAALHHHSPAARDAAIRLLDTTQAARDLEDIVETAGAVETKANG